MDDDTTKKTIESDDKRSDPIPPPFAHAGNEEQKIEAPSPGEGQKKTPRDSANRNLKETIEKGSSKESGSGRLPLGKFDPQDLQRVRDLFVPSSDYRNKVRSGSNPPDYNVWIVYGPEYAGKLTTAMNLALDLLRCEPKDEKVYCYVVLWQIPWRLSILPEVRILSRCQLAS